MVIKAAVVKAQISKLAPRRKLRSDRCWTLAVHAHVRVAREWMEVETGPWTHRYVVWQHVELAPLVSINDADGPG